MSAKRGSSVNQETVQDKTPWTTADISARLNPVSLLAVPAPAWIINDLPGGTLVRTEAVEMIQDAFILAVLSSLA